MGSLSNFSYHQVSYSDTNALKVYFFDLPEGAKVTGDKAYTDYVIEDVMSEANVPLSPCERRTLLVRFHLGSLLDVILS